MPKRHGVRLSTGATVVLLALLVAPVQAVPNPAITVMPDSLSATLAPDGIATRTLTIGNQGTGLLNWTAATEAGNDLTGTRILWDRSHGQTSSAGWSDLIADVESRGAEVVESSATITEDLLSGYHIVWVRSCSSEWTSDETAALAAWVRAGGGLLIIANWFPSLNPLLAAIGTGLVCSGHESYVGSTTEIFPHITTEGVASLYLNELYTYLEAVQPPAVVLASHDGLPTFAASEIGTGRVVMLCGTSLYNNYLPFADNRRFGNQVFDWLTSLAWLSVDPAAGALAPGTTQDLTVTFAAAGLCGEDLATAINVASDDPLRPVVPVAVTLAVDGEPLIAVQPDSLNFGPVFVGGAAADTVTVGNAGCTLLTVSGLGSDTRVFTTTPSAPFTVEPGATQAVLVTFRPLTTGTVTGSLTVASDDPTQPAITVGLTGTGVAPPVIVVTPDSLSSVLAPHELVTQTLTIGNTGAADLAWSAALRPAVGREAGRNDLTGVRILWDRSRGQAGSSAWTALVADVESRGAEVFESTATITAALLATCDIVWSPDLNSGGSWNAATVAALTTWVHGGGSLLLEGDDSSAGFNAVLSSLGAGITYQQANAPGEYTTAILPHQTTTGVSSLHLGSRHARLSAVVAPAGVLARSNAGAAALAWSEVGSGRVIALSDEVLWNAEIDQADNRRFGNQVIDWLANPEWLRFAPDSGVLPPGATQNVVVTLNADACGEFAAALVVTSNDPLTPDLAVPVSLDVAGQSAVVSTDSLAFGSQYIGVVATDTLTVVNDGCGVLHVGEIVTDVADFAISPHGPFTLAPYTAQALLVSYAPAATGPVTGTMILTTDDPGLPVIEVALSGIGVPPPIIEVTPDSLRMDLLPGTMVSRTLTIGNDGHSDLAWTATVTDTEGPLPSRAGLADILSRLDLGHASVSSLVPGRFAFNGGVSGSSIDDGGHNMYDYGNYLRSDLGGPLMYSDGVVVPSAVLGEGGRYFTRKYPGLFVMAADVADVTALRITGNLGANGAGSADGAVLQATVGGKHYLGFVKRVFGTASPSVNHLVIMAADDDAQHTFATDTDDDWHEVSGLAGQSRIFYLLYAAQDGGYVDDATTQRIMETFLSVARLDDEWLEVDPAAGNIAPGATQDVTVTFRAQGQCGWDVATTIAVASNDPFTPHREVPAALRLRGAADIVVSPTVLAYGSQYLGVARAETLEVRNGGCDVLHIGSLTTDHDEFTVVPAGPFALGPAATRLVVATCTPAAVGPLAGALTILSDDPDEPVAEIQLSVIGLHSPAIVVSPESLFADLPPGGATTQTLTLSNAGLGELAWSAAAVRQAGTQDLAGVRILWDRAHGGGLLAGYSHLAADLAQRGAAVFESNAPVTLELLTSCDIVWLTETGPWAAGEIGSLTTWVGRGGSVLFAGDESSVSYNAILTALGAGVTYQTTGGPGGITTAIFPHPTTEGVTSLYLSGPMGWLGAVEAPAGLLANSSSGMASLAWSTVGSGRIVALNDELLSNYDLDRADNRRFGNQIFGWLAGPNWLAVAPEAGVVAPGASQDLTVTFDGRGLCGGILTADLVVASNDPFTAQIVVSAVLDVAGEPDIVVAPASLSFPPQYVGAVTSRTVTVRNDGCEVLTISGVTSDHDEFTVAPEGPFLLAGSASRVVTVTYAAATAGPVSGLLTIASDDADEPLVELTLAGSGLVPPAITVTPDSLAATVFTGDLATRTLRIGNVGSAGLTWSLAVHAGESRFVGLRDLTGVRIMWDRTHGQIFANDRSEVIDDLSQRGAVVVENWQPITPAVLSSFHVIWTAECNTQWTYAEISALAPWLRAGGGLLLEGDDRTHFFNAILSPLAAGITFGGVAAGGSTTLIQPHPTTAGVSRLVVPTPATGLSAVVAPAGVICEDTHGNKEMAWSEVVNGRIVAICDEVLANYTLPAGDNRLFGNQVIDWLAEPTADVWVWPVPLSGVLPEGSHQDVTVTFGSAGLSPGRYVSTLVVSSDDPTTPTIDIPVTLAVVPRPEQAYRRLPAGWSLVSLPLVPPAGSTLTDALLAQAPAGSHLFAWDAAAASHVLVDPDAPCLLGQGLWLTTPATFDWSLVGEPSTAEVSIPLAQGWSLVGYPLWFPGELGAARITHDGAQYTHAEAVALGLVAGLAFAYHPGLGYLATADLEPYHGYWLAAYASGVVLDFAPDDLLPPDPAAAKASESDWAVTIEVEDGSSQIVLGQSTGASDGFDAAWDLPVPPPSPVGGGSAALVLPRSAWPRVSDGLFLRDIRGPGAGPLSFLARLTASRAGSVRLTWQGDRLPADLDLQIRSGGQILVSSLREQDHLELAVDASPLDLEICSSTESPPADWLAEGLHLRNEPNPFNPATTFRFNLARAGETEVLIFDARGVVVRRLQAGELPAGPAQVTWDGCDHRGAGVASGVYLYRLLQAGGQLGETRKMVLLQ